MIWTLEHAKERIDELYREYGAEAIVYIDYEDPCHIRKCLEARGVDMEKLGWTDDELIEKFNDQMQPLSDHDASDVMDSLAEDAKGEYEAEEQEEEQK